MSERGGNPATRSFWSARKTRKSFIGVLSAAILGVAAWLIVPAVTTTDAVRDARTVFCLQPSQRTALVDAAVALEIAGADISGGGAQVDEILRWRSGHEADFTRACDALSAVRNVPAATRTPAAAATIVLPILLAVLTAALTFVTTYRRDRMVRDQTEGDALRASTQTYADAANAYLDGFATFPVTASPAAVDNARTDLTSRLRGVRHRYPEWQAIDGVLAWLGDGELPAAGKELARTQDGAKRHSHIEMAKSQVGQVVDVCNRIVNSLADPARPDPELERPLSGMSRP